jgi:hypothetical protein
MMAPTIPAAVATMVAAAICSSWPDGVVVNALSHSMIVG